MVSAYEQVCHYYDFIYIKMFFNYLSGSWKGGSYEPGFAPGAENAEYCVDL